MSSTTISPSADTLPSFADIVAKKKKIIATIANVVKKDTLRDCNVVLYETRAPQADFLKEEKINYDKKVINDLLASLKIKSSFKSESK